MKKALFFCMTLLIALPGVGARAQSAPSDDKAAKARAMFDQADQDKDGALSLAEWKAIGRREQGFNLIDANKDGRVTPEEIRAAMAAYRRNR